MGTIRLGKRTEGRSPLIKDFVPLAELEDLVFGAWDIFEDNATKRRCTRRARKRIAGAAQAAALESQADAGGLRSEYVKRLSGTTSKKGRPRWSSPNS